MVQFIIGAFIGSVVTFAIMAFIIAASEDRDDKRK